MRKQKTSRIFSIVALSQTWLRAFRKPRPTRAKMKGRLAMKATKQVSPDVGKRISSAAVGFVALFVLAACGGGGGSSTAAPPPGTGGGTPPAPAPAPNPAPPPAPAPSGSLSTAPCVIPAGSDSCDTQIVVDAKATVNASLTVDGEPSVSITPGVTPVTVTLTREGDRNVTLRNGDGKVIATGTVGANCVTDAKWDEAVDKACRVPSYFDELTFGIWDILGHPYVITKTAGLNYTEIDVAFNGVIQKLPLTTLVNKTPWKLNYETGALFFAGFKTVSPVDSQCRIRMTMQSSPDNTSRQLYVDGATLELRVWSDEVANRADYTFSSEFDPLYPDFYTRTDVQGGMFYSTATGVGDPDPNVYREHLWYQPTGGAATLLNSWNFQTKGNLKDTKTFRCPGPRP